MNVQFEWINKSQAANDYFVLEKSADGVHFASLLRQDCSGLSDKVEIYRDMDLNPFEGYNYYRLKLVYKGGSFEYSNIEVVLFNPASGFEIFPNPASNEVNIYLKRFQGKQVDILFSNALGQVIHREQMDEVTDSVFRMELSPGIFKDGIYMVSVVHRGRAV